MLKNLVVIILLSACSHLVAPVQIKYDYLKYDCAHKVKFRGETLSLIASWYTGNNKNWITLAKVNNIKNPKKIKIGQVLLIPAGLLTKYQTMPANFLPKKKIPLKKEKIEQEKYLAKSATLKAARARLGDGFEKRELEKIELEKIERSRFSSLFNSTDK